jgi:hypothetical protein
MCIMARDITAISTYTASMAIIITVTITLVASKSIPTGPTIHCTSRIQSIIDTTWVKHYPFDATSSRVSLSEESPLA